MRAFSNGRFFSKAGFLLSCMLLFSVQTHAQAINTSSIYRNDSVGIRGAFGEWDIITTREQAPQALKPNFPENKGPNESPLFIGIHGSEQVFIRLLTETYFDDLEAYAKILSQGVISQGLEISSAKISIDSAALELDYRHPQLGLRFLERVALLPDSQVVRMAAWSTENAWDTYEGEIKLAFRDIELNDVINAEPGWQPVWADLDQRLQDSSLSGIELAQIAAPVVGTSSSCPDPTSSMLWRVQSPSLSDDGSELYLFGSIHVGKADFYPLPGEIENTFNTADYLVFEVDPTSVADPSVLMSMQTRGMLPQGQSLEDVVSAEVITDFRRVMGNMGLPAENFMGMKPWFLTLMLSSLQMNALGYMPEYGLESYFLSRKPVSVDILELESIQQQIGFLENLNAETFLAYTLKSFDTGSEEIESLINAWKCADKGPLTDMLFADFDATDMSVSQRAEMDALMESLYNRRNIDMAEKIAAFADGPQGNYFVVIGSAHLLGGESVVTLLRDRGFSVIPVSLTP